MRRVKVFLGILLLSLPLGIFGQSFSARSYTVSDGLISSTVRDIVQDSLGVMWFATARGISCYDGNTWIHYTHGKDFPFRDCYFLLIDHRDRVWTFTDDIGDGAAFFDPLSATWKHIKNPLTSAGGMSFENKMIAGVALLANEGDMLPYIGAGTTGQGFYLLSGKRWKHLPYQSEKNETPPRLYDTIAWNGSFYLATERGLYSINPATLSQWTAHSLNLPSPEIYSLAIASYIKKKPDRLWAVGEVWAGYLWRDGFKLIYEGKFPEGFYNTISKRRHLFSWPDPFGGFWIGHDKVILRISKSGTHKMFKILSNITSHGAYKFYYDNESSLWLGNFRGAHRISNLQFENYTEKDGLLKNEVTSMHGFQNGMLVFGHSGGFSFLHQGKISTLTLQSETGAFLNDVRVLNMCRDRDGNIWAAIEQFGIAKITPDLRLKRYRANTLSKFQSYNSLALDNSGGLWMGAGNRLFMLNRKTGTFDIVTRCPAPSRYIRSLYFDTQNTLWVATGEHGIYKFKDNRFARIKSYSERKANSVFALYRDRNDRLIAGTKAGLFEVAENKMIRMDFDGLKVKDPVYFIIEEPGRGLWFGTDNGVINWKNGRLHHYTTKNGLVGRETNRSAAWFDKEGHLWIGFDLGASRYLRHREVPVRPPPRLEFLHLDASGVLHPLDRKNRLNSHHNDLTFYFRGISYIDENELIYSYKLDGFDPDWTTRARDFGNQVRYTNLPPGQYRFNIKVARPSGETSPTLSSASILIKKPFHQSVLFYLIIGSVGLLLFLFVLTYINKRRHAHQLEQEVRQRTHQLEESEQETRYLFDNVHDAIFIIDPENEVVLDLNNRACEQYGFTRQEFIGMSLKDISESVPRGEDMVTDTFESGSIRGVDSIQFRKDGSKMYLEINASLVNYRGKTAILSVNRDITERRKTELQTKQSLDEKTVLLQEVHHRVKNNLQIISSLLDLQADGMDDPKVARLLMENKSRVHSLALLYDNLFQSENLARINIDEYIYDIVAYLFSFVNKSEIRYSLDVDPVSIEMDKAIPMGLILTELVFNALKHAFPGEGEGKVSVSLHRAEKKNVILKVWDNGVGLGENTPIRKSGSLGLQLVSSLTGQLKGSMEIEESGGTSFILTFPTQDTHSGEN